MRSQEFDRGQSRPAHVHTGDAGFTWVHPEQATKGLRRIVSEGTGYLAPDAQLHTHQHRLVRGTLEHIAAGGPTTGAPDPLVRVHPDGRTFVLDGHHRIAVDRAAGRRTKVQRQVMGF